MCTKYSMNFYTVTFNRFRCVDLNYHWNHIRYVCVKKGYCRFPTKSTLYSRHLVNTTSERRSEVTTANDISYRFCFRVLKSGIPMQNSTTIVSNWTILNRISLDKDGNCTVPHKYCVINEHSNRVNKIIHFQ